MDDKIESILELLKSINIQNSEQFEQITQLRLDFVKHQAVFEAHLKQDEELAKIVDEINNKLGEYNTQLKIHIAGVLELKKMNELFKKQLNLKEKEINERLEELEQSRIWLRQTFTIAKYISTISAAVGAVYAFIKYLLPHI